MIGNIALLLIVIAITGLLYRFPLRNPKTPPDTYRKLVLFFGILTFAALFNGFLAFLGMSGLRLASSRPPITALAALSEYTPGDGIILIGEVSVRNEATYQEEYIAYTDEGGRVWSPEQLWIDVQAGSFAIINTTYQAIGWPIDAGGNSYLRAKQPVTVVGVLEDRIDPAREQKVYTLRADIVYARSYDDFVARARFKMILAAAMIAANACVVILILVFMLPPCIKRMKKP